MIEVYKTETSKRDWQRWYCEYIQSDTWKRRRAAVFNRAGDICEACGFEPADEVHHTTYRNVGREPLYELRAVCKNCHRIIHDREG